MAEFSFSQYQELMAPITDLVSGIVKIVGYSTPEEEKEVADDLMTQILISTVVFHFSERELMNQLPETEEIEKLIDEKKGEEFLKLFTGDLSLEKLFTYLQSSASIVMTNYHEQIKERLTPEKLTSIQNLYQQVEERIKA